ncbi:uncharacterized protein LOC144034266 isoform X1 [Vanacampus margaritifer]
MPQLRDDADLGANDELIPFKDECEQDDKTAAAARRDLDDVKSSLVNESESNNNASDCEAADERATRQPDAVGRTGLSQLLGEEALRRPTGGLFQLPAYMGYPFFMIPDLCGSYLAGGGLAALVARPAERLALIFCRRRRRHQTGTWRGPRVQPAEEVIGSGADCRGGGWRWRSEGQRSHQEASQRLHVVYEGRAAQSGGPVPSQGERHHQPDTGTAVAFSEQRRAGQILRAGPERASGPLATLPGMVGQRQLRQEEEEEEEQERNPSRRRHRRPPRRPNARRCRPRTMRRPTPTTLACTHALICRARTQSPICHTRTCPRPAPPPPWTPRPRLPRRWRHPPPRCPRTQNTHTATTSRSPSPRSRRAARTPPCRPRPPRNRPPPPPTDEPIGFQMFSCSRKATSLWSIFDFVLTRFPSFSRTNFFIVK